MSGEGDQELAADGVQSENPISHPVEVSGIQLAVGLELWGGASFL